VLFFALLFAFALSFLGEPARPLLRIIDNSLVMRLRRILLDRFRVDCSGIDIHAN
jgi:Na+/H+-dicarboxylate symporter